MVLIVDDHQMLAEALARGLTTRGFQCHIADVSSVETVMKVASHVSPDLVLLDLDLGAIDGLRMVGALRAGGRRVLVVTGCEDRQRLAAAVTLGSVGWVAKARPFEEVLDAAESALRDRPLLAPEHLDHLTKAGRRYVTSDADVQRRIATLTPREREVLDAIIRGDTTQEMVERFTISNGTVRTHIGSVLAKLGVSSQLAAAAVAVRWAASKRGLDHDDLLAPLRPSA